MTFAPKLKGVSISWVASRLACRKMSSLPLHSKEAVLSKVGEVHQTPHRIVFAFAGAGSKALSLLHAVGGSSRTLLEAVDTYSPASLADFTGTHIQKAVAPDAARLMAERSFQRARKLAGEEKWPILGLSCTAAIATDRTKKGMHRCVVGVTSTFGTDTYDVVLEKGARSREEEEDVVASIVLNSLCKGAGVKPLPLQLREKESITELFFPARDADKDLVDAIQQLKVQKAPVVVVSKDRSISLKPISNAVVLSGSFNPLHKGHRTMLEEASTHIQNKEPYFELAIQNADKGTTSTAEILRRLDQFTGAFNVVLTMEPLFQDKTQHMKDSVFVVGYDTAVRLVDPKYYGGAEGLAACMEKIKGNGCQFLVAGRKHDGHFQTLEDIPETSKFAGLFRPLPDFRIDISSTELRKQSSL